MAAILGVRFHMQWLASLSSRVIDVWANLPLGTAEKTSLKAFLTGLLLFLIVYAVERIYRVRDNDFRSRGFVHDIVYWFYYRTNLNYFLYTTVLLAALEEPLSFLDLKLVSSLPAALQAVLIFLVGDFVGYWAHRAQHSFKFLWAFHTTHHSQEQVNIFTGARFHPIDALWLLLFAYLPLRIMGGSSQIWPWLAFLIWIVNMLIHSRIPWGYGPLHKLLVSPNFHAYHHSTDPAHFNKNFSTGTFCVWDYMFGTAVKDREPIPTLFGLTNVKPTSLWSTLVTPFRLLGEFYLTPVSGKISDSR